MGLNSDIYNNLRFASGIDDIEDSPDVLQYCWKSTLSKYLATDCDTFLKVMSSNYRRTLTPIMFPDDDVADLVEIWREEYVNMHDDLMAIEAAFPRSFSIVFEYTIKGTSNCRPDVLLVSSNVVIIIEYKNHANYKRAESNVRFQTGVYYRELSEMHNLSADSLFITIGFFGKEKGLNLIQKDRENYYFCSPGYMAPCIKLSLEKTSVEPCDVDVWINSPMDLRPDIINCAIQTWKGKDLTKARIHRSTKIKEALDRLQANIDEFAAKDKQHMIVFVSGVPGAGKTYLGLQLVFNNLKKYGATYYSGNGPLVEVLGSKIPAAKSAIKGIMDFKSDHYKDFKVSKYDINSHVIVFDEGQRAWDNVVTEKNSKYFAPDIKVSEPDFILRTLMNHTEWCALIVLIGDGQSIHYRETNDPQIWEKALSKNAGWSYIHPNNYEEFFPKVAEGKKPRGRDYLKLDVDLRKITKEKAIIKTSDFAKWLFRVDRVALKESIKMLLRADYEIELVQDLEEAKKMIRERFSKERSMSYGLITSSKNKDIFNYGLKTVKTQKQIEWAKKENKNLDAVSCSEWYETLPERTLIERLFRKNKDNATLPNNSCQLLEAAADEFSCQGLELDYTILLWGTDMVLENGKWRAYTLSRKGERTPIGNNEIERNYRFNSYHVLLSRARYGMIIYVPNMPIMNETFRFMQEVLLEARRL